MNEGKDTRDRCREKHTETGGLNMNRFCSSCSYPPLPLAVSAREEREERALPKVSPDDVKREAKEAVGAAVEYPKQDPISAKIRP